MCDNTSASWSTEGSIRAQYLEQIRQCPLYRHDPDMFDEHLNMHAGDIEDWFANCVGSPEQQERWLQLIANVPMYVNDTRAFTNDYDHLEVEGENVRSWYLSLTEWYERPSLAVFLPST